ncbi:MAG: glycerol-3-phosphate 1-O-acyltransferase PlsY [Rickettsiales bacterium]|nr:glycerol-3-phosphate 1-O-acyltransferase PlsY [Rickettsiales bacterium]
MISFSQIIFWIITYLVSSIPFGLLLSLLFAKKDIREFGSKNIGATNVTRVLGKKLGFATLILDGLKGAGMVMFGRYFFDGTIGLQDYLYGVAFVAILGHVFSIYLKFKGGKGVATTVATLLALDLVLGGLVILIWLLMFAIFRISALSALVSIFGAVMLVIFGGYSVVQIGFMSLVFLLIVVRHKDNIVKLKNDFKR